VLDIRDMPSTLKRASHSLLYIRPSALQRSISCINKDSSERVYVVPLPDVLAVPR
jgi:hypothetical protein